MRDHHGTTTSVLEIQVWRSPTTKLICSPFVFGITLFRSPMTRRLLRRHRHSLLLSQRVIHKSCTLFLQFVLLLYPGPIPPVFHFWRSTRKPTPAHYFLLLCRRFGCCNQKQINPVRYGVVGSRHDASCLLLCFVWGSCVGIITAKKVANTGFFPQDETRE